jgi:hypothetical protein
MNYYILFLLIIIILIYVYFNKNIDTFTNQINTNNLNTTLHKIDLSLDKTNKIDCKNNFCYYNLNKNYNQNFENKNNNSDTVIITGGKIPILLKNGLQININIINNKVEYSIIPL